MNDVPNSSRWIDFMLEHQVVGFFETPVTLASGQTSHWYVNWRKIAEDVYLLDRLSDLLLDTIDQMNLTPDTWYGVPEGATKLALLAQYKSASRSPRYAANSHVFAMGRGKAKAHGSLADRSFLGLPRGRVVILEDVTTTGDSLCAEIERLQQAQVQVSAAVCLTNRTTPQSAEALQRRLAALGVPLHAMTQAQMLLPHALERLHPPANIAAAVKQEFAQGEPQ